MTVSPPWPQDGNRQPKMSGRGVRSGAVPRSPELPPTLFTLPNLKPAPPAAAPATQSIDKPALPAEVTTQTPDSASVASRPSSPSARRRPDPELPTHPGRHADRNDQTRPPTTPVIADTTATPANTIESPHRAESSPPTVPAPRSKSPVRRRVDSSLMPVARSWIETLGSHGVIAVLLLIVVGAALFTGRESGDLDNESSLAESGELLDIDNGTQVDLPIPPHDLGPTADLSATNQAATPTSDDDVVPPTLSAGLSARTDSAASAGSAADAAGAGQVPSAAASMARQSLARDSYDSGAAGTKDPLVSLDAPQASSAATWQNDQPNLDTGQFSRPQPGEFMTAPANVDVLAAANRTVPDSRASELPSLEDLTGAHASHAQSGTALHPGPTPVFSKTPFGVQDWSQYLPRDQPAVAADTEIPSTSNSLQTR